MMYSGDEFYGDDVTSPLVRSMPPVAPTISAPVAVERYFADTRMFETNRAFEVIVSYRRYRLHNERPYGIDGVGAFADSATRWCETDMNRLDLPAETIAQLQALWRSLFTA